MNNQDANFPTGQRVVYFGPTFPALPYGDHLRVVANDGKFVTCDDFCGNTFQIRPSNLRRIDHECFCESCHRGDR